MLIKINTSFYSGPEFGENGTYIPSGVVYINPDKIIDAGPNSQDTAWFIDLGDADHRYTVTSDEWLRILPLLNTPAPVAAVPVPSPVESTSLFLSEEWHSKYRALIRKWAVADLVSDQSREYEIVSQRCYQDLVDHSRYTPSTLPTDVITAYQRLKDVRSGKYTYSTSDHRVMIEFENVMDAYMPAASEESAE
jgi:hypothetical protein